MKEQYQPIDGEALLQSKALEKAQKEATGRFQPNAEMSKITWLRAGGLAELLYQPADEEDLARLLANLPKEIPVTIMGIGSNMLIRDGGIKGIVLRLPAKAFGQIEQVDETHLLAGVAASDKRVAAAALEAELDGFHFYHGIPGSIGGALTMNAGANGGETVEVVEKVYAIDRQGQKHVLTNADMGFAYRHVAVANGELFFTKVLLKGVPGTKDKIQKAMDAVQEHRETKQPIREKTGGSTFRNPEGHSSWKLIAAAGCRGLTIGGAHMSRQHCNFMINDGTATGHDLELLGETVRQRVYESSGIQLRWEIKRLGQFMPGQEISQAFAN